MQSLTTGVWISSRCLTTGHSVAEGSQNPFTPWQYSKGRAVSDLYDAGARLWEGLARNCGGLNRDSFADPAQLRTSPSRMGWRRALFQGNSEKAVHDSLEEAGVMMKCVGVRRCN